MKNIIRLHKNFIKQGITNSLMLDNGERYRYEYLNDNEFRFGPEKSLMSFLIGNTSSNA